MHNQPLYWTIFSPLRASKIAAEVRVKFSFHPHSVHATAIIVLRVWHCLEGER